MYYDITYHNGWSEERVFAYLDAHNASSYVMYESHRYRVVIMSNGDVWKERIHRNVHEVRINGELVQTTYQLPT